MGRSKTEVSSSAKVKNCTFFISIKNHTPFKAFIIGLITDTKGGTLTHLYQASASQTRYWSFPKFLSRGKWEVSDAVAAHLIRYIQQTFGNSVYVYDETKALKTGASQYGFAFFPQLQLPKASRESIKVSLRTRVWSPRLTLCDRNRVAAFPGLGETYRPPNASR